MPVTDAATPSQPRGFLTTRWSLVLRAAEGESRVMNAALEQLCRLYWYPVYVFMRRRGHDEHEAKDLVQGFFAELLEKQFVAQADRERGKFRTFLLTAAGHYAGHEREKARAQKRGGGFRLESWDAVSPEERYRYEPADTDTPERAFERRWAASVLERTVARLGAEMEPGRFAQLKPFLLRTRESSYAAAAESLGLSEQAVKSAIHRMRQRFQQIFREEIADTVLDPADVDGEIRHLCALLAES